METYKPIEFIKPTCGLAEALREAQKAAYAGDPGDDGGTCNLDYVMIRLPRWRASKVEAEARAAGANIYKDSSRPGIWNYNPETYGQANRRTEMVRAASLRLHELGYSTQVAYLTD